MRMDISVRKRTDMADHIIAIDLGSNTCRVIEYFGYQKTFGRAFERIVKTADRLHETGQINDAAVSRVVEALQEADKIFNFETSRIKAVATAAMRMADNADAVLQTLEKETGVLFEIIDADQEAQYTMTAVRDRLGRLEIPRQSLAMIDVGGGSSEVIFYKNGERISQSFPIGIVTIAQQCDTPDEVKSKLDRVMFPVTEFIHDYYSINGRAETFVATAGTPTTIAAFIQGMTYANYDPERINGFRLTLEESEFALRDLQRMDEKIRSIYVGVGRETLIVAGVVIVQAFYRALGFEEAIVIDDGVREGVAITHG